MSDDDASSEEEEFTFGNNSPSRSSRKKKVKREDDNDEDDDYNDYNDDDDDDDDDDDEDYSVPKKEKKRAPSSSPAAAAAASTGTSRKRVPVKYEEHDDDDDEDENFDDYNDDDDDYRQSPASAAAAKKKKKTAVSKNKVKREPAVAEKKKKRDSSSVSAKSEKTNHKKRKSSSSSAAAAAAASKRVKVKSDPAAGTPAKKGGAAATAAAAGRELKKLDKAERLQYAMQSFLWWDAPEPPAGCQWVTMEHAGVSFPDPYEPHGVKMKYDGVRQQLTAAQEEAATFYAAMDPDGMHLGNPKTARIFQKNFFEDFRSVLGKKHVVRDFSKCDFDDIRRHLNERKMVKKAITDEERKANKAASHKTLFRYGFAIVDGHIERVGNYNMEPPGAFRGRGEHPKMGKLKQRVLPEQVSLNLSEGAAVPVCSVPGHAWSDVRHDPRGMWLATWKENINNQSKYMQLAAQSSFKGKSDRSKYSKAALLCEHISSIRKSYKKDLKSRDAETRQLATAVWVIDRLALRVGGEKDTDEEADTVGCCSLRVEHLHFDPNEEGGDNQEIELEFLGKDSMLYKQTIDFGAGMYNDNNGMGSQVYENFVHFCKKKKPNQEVFDVINPSMLNNHLKQFMDGLSAKVFRTYNASKTLQEELAKHEQSSPLWKNLTAAEKVTEYNNANREVAILCNHQKSVSKAQETQLENIQAKLNTLKKQRKELKGILKKLNKKETDGIPIKKSIQAMNADVQDAVAAAKRMKETASSVQEKIAATEADEAAKEKKRKLADVKFRKAHLWEKLPSKDQVIKRIETWAGKIAKMEMDLKHKDDNKEVSLGTSKINYMDPRISVAWCKRNEVPIEKIFSKTLRDKFNWAMAVEPDWEFNADIGKQG